MKNSLKWLIAIFLLSLGVTKSYSQNPFESFGDKYFQQGNYQQAIVEYTKVVNSSYYRGYNIYMKRANAFIKMEF